MSGKRWTYGVVAHLSVYGFITDTHDAILQAFFFEAAENDRICPRVFIFPVPIPKEGVGRTSLLRDYASSLVTNLAAAALGDDTDEAGRSDKDHSISISRRSSALAKLLLEGRGPDFGMLAYSFYPLEILTDGLEIFSVRPWKSGVVGFLHAVAAFSVARIRGIGSYHSEYSGDFSTLAENCGAYQTHANKKLCRGFTSRGLVFSIRVGTRKMIFEDVVGGRMSPVSDLFDITDVKWRSKKLRLCVPRGFLAFAFSDEQCLQLLRDAFHKLFREIYGGFSGIYPIFDYLGPNMLRSGGPRSVFLPGFPCVPVYSVCWRYDLSMENGADAVNELRGMAGLPDIVGPAGKLVLMPSIGNVVDAIWPTRYEELIPYYADIRHFRINARWCRVCDISDCVIDDADEIFAHVYVGDGSITRISFPELRCAVIRMCLPGREFPFTMVDTSRRVDRGMITAFLSRLKHKNMRLFQFVRSMENYVCKSLTDACDAAGFPWILVRNDCEIYVRRQSYRNDVQLEIKVREVMNTVWSDLFGVGHTAPSCRFAICHGGVLVATGRYLMSGFADEQREHPTPGWIAATGRMLSEAIFCALDSKDWTAKEKIIRFMATHMLRLSARRHETRFWIQRFSPGKNTVDDHLGVQDASEYTGIHICGRMVALQVLDGALHDDICYMDYVRRTFGILKICLRQVIINLSQPVIDLTGVNGVGDIEVTEDHSDEVKVALAEFNEAFEQAQLFVINRYSAFFTMN
nr:helicase-primase subunit [Mastomys natalensis cytomegalovirus 3]WEG69927.1 helicase-primase subunit [Mastomys natalensis cytomegalovirus 3]WEG70067.1 helicase-primase subunit [Mastomys natalensis cytomegalovirus 3]WEG70207.1 helicase-primase subunit [Mastomys natalensis cytomegalovirus 3]WEG70347.1 helicase-primase subunit [Mastomys natalensis cytomegalovirus 3]